MTATGIISNIIYITENQNKPKVAKHNLKDFSGLFPLDLYSGLWHFQTITGCKLFTMNLTEVRKFIDMFYFREISLRNLHFPHINTAQIDLR